MKPRPYFNQLLLPIWLCCLLVAPVAAAEATGATQRLTTPHLDLALLSEQQEIIPGQPFWVAIKLNPEPGWHTYWQNPGDTGLPVRIGWQLPEGSQAGPV